MMEILRGLKSTAEEILTPGRVVEKDPELKREFERWDAQCVTSDVVTGAVVPNTARDFLRWKKEADRPKPVKTIYEDGRVDFGKLPATKYDRLLRVIGIAAVTNWMIRIGEPEIFRQLDAKVAARLKDESVRMSPEERTRRGIIDQRFS